MDLTNCLALFTTKGEILPSSESWGVHEFPDGQHQFWIKKYVMEWPLYPVCCLRSGEALDVCLQALDLLSKGGKMGMPSITYLYGARSDKWENEDTFVSNTADHTLRLLGARTGMGQDPNPLKILDPHNILGPSTIVGRGFLGVDLSKYTLVIYPDASARERFSSIHPSDLPYIVCSKHRDQASGTIVQHIVPEFDYSKHRVLVADDICDGGRTFISLAEKVIGEESPPESLDLYVTHGLLTNGATEKLRSAGYGQIFTTNSYHRHLKTVGKLTVTDVWKPQDLGPTWRF